VYLIVYRHTIITNFSLRRFWKSIVRKTELELYLGLWERIGFNVNGIELSWYAVMNFLSHLAGRRVFS